MSVFNKKIHLPIQEIKNDLLLSKGVELSMLRMDKTDEHISGNKYFKLKYNLQQAELEKKNAILSFGGAYSNHIAALAAAGKYFGFRTIGIIRGEEQLPLNETLELAKKHGMEIYYLDRHTFRNKENLEPFEYLKQELGDFYFLPEGGTNSYAIQGTKEIMNFIPDQFDTICCGIGTGGTIAGIIEAAREHQSVLGFSALKGDFVHGMIEDLLSRPYDHWSLAPDYSFGGFAKVKPDLIKFILDFEEEFDIPLEQVYTGKMMYGIMDMIEKDYFAGGTKIMAIHTGGLQGRNLFL